MLQDFSVHHTFIVICSHHTMLQLPVTFKTSMKEQFIAQNWSWKLRAEMCGPPVMNELPHAIPVGLLSKDFHVHTFTQTIDEYSILLSEMAQILN